MNRVRTHRVVEVIRRNTDGVIWTRALCSCGYFTPWMFGERNARTAAADNCQARR
jgi:hypothetical protein